MSKLTSIFILNSNGELEVNRPEVRKIPAFKALFDRDKGSIGDSEGKKKYIATGEIFYIYLVYDIRSLYTNLDLEKRIEFAIRDARLPNNWKEDDVVREAIKEYHLQFELNAEGNAYATAERMYYTIVEDSKDMLNNVIELKTLLKGIMQKLSSTTTKVGEIEKISLSADVASIIKSIAGTQKEMIANTKSFTALAKTVKELEIAFIESDGNSKTPVGGGELNPREI